MIKIIVGGKSREIEVNTTIAQLLAIENVEMPEYVSVSVNEEFAKREKFSSQTLKDGDVVEFLYFMGGGSQNGIFQ